MTNPKTKKIFKSPTKQKKDWSVIEDSIKKGVPVEFILHKHQMRLPTLKKFVCDNDIQQGYYLIDEYKKRDRSNSIFKGDNGKAHMILSMAGRKNPSLQAVEEVVKLMDYTKKTAHQKVVYLFKDILFMRNYEDKIDKIALLF